MCLLTSDLFKGDGGICTDISPALCPARLQPHLFYLRLFSILECAASCVSGTRYSPPVSIRLLDMTEVHSADTPLSDQIDFYRILWLIGVNK